MNKIYTSSHGIVTVLVLLTASISFSQSKMTPEMQADQLAKETANPIASLISVPFQNNFDYNYGTLGGYRYTLNFQPVVPAKLGKSLTLLNRIIVPFMTQRNVVDDSIQTGLSNTLYTGYFSPETKGIIFGAGPAISFPATNEYLGAKNWLGGAALIVLVQPKAWTVGFLSNNQWALNIDSAKPNVNNLYFQPFVSYRTKGAFTIGFSSENTYDWLNKRLLSGMVALNMSQIIKIAGLLPASVQVSPKYFYASNQVVRPDWGVRVTLNFLFPQK